MQNHSKLASRRKRGPVLDAWPYILSILYHNFTYSKFQIFLFAIIMFLKCTDPIWICFQVTFRHLYTGCEWEGRCKKCVLCVVVICLWWLSKCPDFTTVFFFLFFFFFSSIAMKLSNSCLFLQWLFSFYHLKTFYHVMYWVDICLHRSYYVFVFNVLCRALCKTSIADWATLDKY